MHILLESGNCNQQMDMEQKDSYKNRKALFWNMIGKLISVYKQEVRTFEYKRETVGF